MQTGMLLHGTPPPPAYIYIYVLAPVSFGGGTLLRTTAHECVGFVRNGGEGIPSRPCPVCGEVWRDKRDGLSLLRHK